MWETIPMEEAFLLSSIQIQRHCPMSPQIQLSSSLSACGHRLQKKFSLLDYAHSTGFFMGFWEGVCVSKNLLPN